MRVSDIGRSDISLRSLQRAGSSYDAVLNKLSTGKNIIKGHEDPALAHKAMKYQNYQVQYKQYSKNCSDAKSIVDYTESTLTNLSDVMVRMKELVTEGANGTMSSDERAAIGQEINELIKEVADLGNANFNGKYLFAGTNTTTKPFDLTGDPPVSITYNGNSDTIQYQIHDNFKMDVNIPGDSAFNGLISNMITVRDHVENGDLSSLGTSDIDNLDSDIDNVLAIRTKLGAKSNVIDITLDRLSASNLEIEKMYSGIMDTDVTKATVDFNLKQNSLQMSLSMISKMSQLNLANYLK